MGQNMIRNPLSEFEYPLMHFGNLVVARSGLHVCQAFNESIAKQICSDLNKEQELRVASVRVGKGNPAAAYSFL
jgi:hypothetical protein